MLTLFGAATVTIMLIAYALESRAATWVLVFALACAASSAYGWLAGTWPFGVVEGIWALVAARRWLLRRTADRQAAQDDPTTASRSSA